MTDIVLNKQEILQEAQRNVRKFGNTVYTYDAEFDVLRVNFGGYFHQFPVNEYKNGFFASFDSCGRVRYVEMLDFLGEYADACIQEAFPSLDVQHILKGIYKELEAAQSQS